MVLKDQAGNPLATGYVSGTGWRPRKLPAGKQVSVGIVQANPAGVAVDGLDDVFIAESGTGNVYKEEFDPTPLCRVQLRKNHRCHGTHPPHRGGCGWCGECLYRHFQRGHKEAPAHGTYVQSRIFTDLTNIVAIAVDAGGNLYLTSSSFGNVHKETLQTDGTYTETAIGYAITSPRGVGVDGKGDIFILDDKRNVLYTGDAAGERQLSAEFVAPGYRAGTKPDGR